MLNLATQLLPGSYCMKISNLVTANLYLNTSLGCKTHFNLTMHLISST